MSGPRNRLEDLNNHLFEQLERLNDDNLQDEKLKDEIDRSKAISNIAKNVIDNGNLVLDAQKFADDKWDENRKLPNMLESRSSEEDG